MEWRGCIRRRQSAVTALLPTLLLAAAACFCLLFVHARMAPFATASPACSATHEPAASSPPPLVRVAILAKQKATMLPTWLASFDAWDYPKDRMVVYIRANDCADATKSILHDWAEINRHRYADVLGDYSDVAAAVASYGVHEWNAERFAVLGAIRERSVAAAIVAHASFYFVCDVDNLLLPHTLSTLVRWNQTIVAPFLHYALELNESNRRSDYSTTYSNYHNQADQNGYFQANDEYEPIRSRRVRGLIQCDVVHCTYLVRSDILPSVRYVDGSARFEYVVFSDNARKLGIPQYLDNREVYGYLSLTEDVDSLRHAMSQL